jgi:uncharacterized protein YyaL (SSP411 family)
MSNRLADETSPYLLQHADNPVDWHPWDEQALALAREQNKPILLSIGYSACHWCHVMAHESFEDEATAAVMNRLFVNVKVDREERPDLDRIYQIAHQMLIGHGGGWPLTMFLTPVEHVPIFAGTYFPKEANYGMPAFTDLLARVESYFRSHLPDIRGSGEKLVEALDNLNGGAADPEQTLSAAPVELARQRLGEAFDARHGGFGRAPKFPHPSNLDLLLAIAARARSNGEPDTGAEHMVQLSLECMARGGLYDHLGGGFFRYSVDDHWAIPHFEKMLYDNAALLGSYSEAYAAYGTPLFAAAASATADWVLRDMQAESGAFFATLDADSEGHEGKFYVWTPEQFDAVLDPPESAAAKRFFGLDKAPNFESKTWHLQAGIEASHDPADAGLLESARTKLLAARERRAWPGRDEKVLVAWNGLMIGGLAKAARHLRRPELAEEARRAADFIRTRLWADGRLKATYKDGRARFDAYLDDYAFLAQGLLELLQCRFRRDDLAFAVDLLDTLLARFGDPRGGFFFTADDHEQLIHRPKPLSDEAIPAGNGIAALALSQLGHLIGEPRYLHAAERTVRSALDALERHPEAHASLLRALQSQLEPPEIVVVRADENAFGPWQDAVAGYRPNRLSFFVPNGARELPGVLAERKSGDGALAYLCQGLQCLAPLDSPAALRTALHNGAD